MKLLADKKIPHISHLFADHFAIETFEDNQLSTADLTQTEVLIVRSTLKINSRLLANSQVRIVASPTSGFDHLDTAWLEQEGIHWFNAPGGNAQAVTDYVKSCIAYLLQQHILRPPLKRAGVIGAGQVGQRVIKQLQQFGFEVIVHDPPKAERDADFISTPLSEFKQLDLLCIHAALTQQGRYPSYHLVDKHLLQQQSSGCVLLNAARGAIVNTTALKQYGTHCHWCVDVYEHEPTIDPDLIDRAIIATPHIAGHTQQAKWQGVYQLYQAIMNYYDYPITAKNKFPPTAGQQRPMDVEKILADYNPHQDTLTFRQTIKEQGDIKKAFVTMRNQYAR